MARKSILNRPVLFCRTSQFLSYALLSFHVLFLFVLHVPTFVIISTNFLSKSSTAFFYYLNRKIKMPSPMFPLHRAALTGNVAELQSLLQQSQQLQLINSKDNYCFTPLLHATNSGNFEALVMLLEKGAKTDICDYRGRAALHYAAEKGRLDMLLVLLDRGANTEQTDNNHRTALHLTSSTEIVKALIENKSKMTESRSNQEIEGDAAENGNEPANIETDTNSLMDSIELSEARLGSVGINAFHYAVMNGNLQMVQAFIRNDVNVNMKSPNGNTALHLAAIRGFADIVRELLKYGADVNLTNNLGEYASALAVEQEKEDCVALLMVNFPPINDICMNKHIISAIKLAGRKGNLTIVQLMWDIYGFKYKTGLNDLEGIFHWAIDSNYLKLATTITSKDNFDINVRHQNQTALHKVVRLNNLQMLQWLLANPKIDINTIDDREKTPLYYAVSDSKKEIIELLFDKGVLLKNDVIEFMSFQSDYLSSDIIQLVQNYSKKLYKTAIKLQDEY